MDTKDFFETIIKEFFSKADGRIINGFIIAFGGITIITLLILVFIGIRKVIKPFFKEEQYDILQKKYLEMHTTYNDMFNLYKKYSNMTNVSLQLFYEINNIIYCFVKNSNVEQDCLDLIQSIVYTIPQVIKSKNGEQHRCILWKPDAKKEYLYVYFNSAISSKEKNIGKRLNIKESFAGRVFDTAKIRNSGNVEKDSEYKINPNNKLNYLSLLGIPILKGEEVVAVLTLDAKNENAFSDEDIENIDIYSIMLSLCLLISECKTAKIDVSEE